MSEDDIRAAAWEERMMLACQCGGECLRCRAHEALVAGLSSSELDAVIEVELLFAGLDDEDRWVEAHRE